MGWDPSLLGESEAFETTKINLKKYFFPFFIEITPDSSAKFILGAPCPVRGITRALFQGVSTAKQSQPAPMQSHSAMEEKKKQLKFCLKSGKKPYSLIQ